MNQHRHPRSGSYNKTAGRKGEGGNPNKKMKLEKDAMNLVCVACGEKKQRLQPTSVWK